MPINETKIYHIKVIRNDISYLRWTIESYDGMAVVSTLDPKAALLEIKVAAGCENIFINLINSLIQHDHIKIDLSCNIL